MPCKCKLQSSLHTMNLNIASHHPSSFLINSQSPELFSTTKHLPLCPCLSSLLNLSMPLSSHFTRRLLEPLSSVPICISHSTSALRFMCPNHVITCTTGHCLTVNMLQIKYIFFRPQYYFFFFFFKLYLIHAVSKISVSFQNYLQLKDV